MKTFWLRHSILILAIGCLCNPVFAAQREVNYAKSSLSFTVKQMGVPVDGSFKKYNAKLNFDPANAAGASAQIEIDMASVDTGSEEGDGEVKRKSWFNIKEFPTAKFVSTNLKKKGDKLFEAAGKLTIKSKSRDVVLPFNVSEDASGTTLTGQFTLKRLEFSIGDGPWNDPETVADEVIVKYKLVLAPLKK